MTELAWFLPALAGVLLVRIFMLVFTRVLGHSMKPTLHTGDWLLVWKLGYRFRQPRRFDVIVCHYPDEHHKRFRWLPKAVVKRVIGLPGETVEIVQGAVLINGEALEQDVTPAWLSRPHPPVTLGEDEYYVLGDNRRNSRDSRSVGPVRRRDITGRAVCILWPLRRIGKIR